MNKSIELEDVYRLEGLPFIKSLLAYEQKRFDECFLLGSVYEDINSQFGIFPPTKHYPVYFVGDITKTKNKYIFIGINPGFDEVKNEEEQMFMEKHGLFEGCCKFFEYMKEHKKGLPRYYAHIGSFLRQLYNIEETIDWDWFQNNFINLELIPYHSKDAGGLRINNPERYKHESFEALLKIIRHIDPKTTIFINGFPGFAEYLSQPLFQDVLSFEKDSSLWYGHLGNYRFVGLPFLNHPRGGKSSLVAALSAHQETARGAV